MWSDGNVININKEEKGSKNRTLRYASKGEERVRKGTEVLNVRDSVGEKMIDPT